MLPEYAFIVGPDVLSCLHRLLLNYLISVWSSGDAHPATDKTSPCRKSLDCPLCLRKVLISVYLHNC